MFRPSLSGKEIFQRGVEELVGAIGSLDGEKYPGDSRYPGPVLVLVYSLIDILASLCRPSGKNRSTREDFLEWVRTYLLPIHNHSISAEDIYGARCGVLHTYGPDSALRESGACRPIFYALREEDESRYQRQLEESGVDALVLHFGVFLVEVRSAIRKFKESVEQDPGLAERVYRRAKTGLFVTVLNEPEEE